MEGRRVNGVALAWPGPSQRHSSGRAPLAPPDCCRPSSSSSSSSQQRAGPSQLNCQGAGGSLTSRDLSGPGPRHLPWQPLPLLPPLLPPEEAPARAGLRRGTVLLRLHWKGPLTLQGGPLLLLPFRVFCFLGAFGGVLCRLGRDEARLRQDGENARLPLLSPEAPSRAAQRSSSPLPAQLSPVAHLLRRDHPPGLAAEPLRPDTP